MKPLPTGRGVTRTDEAWKAFHDGVVEQYEAELAAAHARASFAEADNEHLRAELRGARESSLRQRSRKEMAEAQRDQLRVELTMERLRSKAWKKRAKKARRDRDSTNPGDAARRPGA